MIEKNKIVFLESNTTGTGELLIHKALIKGLHPIFITRDPSRYSFLPIAQAELIILDSNSKEILLGHLSKIENLIGIYSSSENYIEMVSWLANKLNLPGTNFESVRLCRNKYFLYQALMSSEINIPKTQIICDLNEAENVLKEWLFPIIIKPNSGTGSQGVKLCETKKECMEHIHLLLQSVSPEVLIQKYIDAPEFSVEVCSFSGHHQIIGITQKYISNPPYFIETGHDFPAILSAYDENVIKQTVPKLLSLLDFNFGFSHIELRIKNGKAVIIEVNPRLAGGMIPILIEKSTEIDVLSYLIDLYTNHNVYLQITCKKFAAIRHLIPKSSGKIKSLYFKAAIDVDEVKIFKNTGDVFIPQNDFRDRVAYLIVSNIDAECCKDMANRALQNFNIVFESGELNLA